MIIDKIENADKYAALDERLAKGLKLIQDPSMTDKEDGTYKVEGDDLFYMIQKYTTKNKEDLLFEAHKEYIDIQAVIEGCETIGWAPADSMEIMEPYTHDICKGSVPAVFTELKMAEGTFGIFFPEDAHKPGYDCREKGTVTKIVVKVKI